MSAIDKLLDRLVAQTLKVAELKTENVGLFSQVRELERKLHDPNARVGVYITHEEKAELEARVSIAERRAVQLEEAFAALVEKHSAPKLVRRTRKR